MAQLIAVLHRAQDTADPAPVRALARRLDPLPEVAGNSSVAVALSMMSAEAGAVPGRPDDPYHHWHTFAFQHGLCTRQDLERAWDPHLLVFGVRHGWLMAHGGGTGPLAGLMARIERRECP